MWNTIACVINRSPIFLISDITVGHLKNCQQSLNEHYAISQKHMTCVPSRSCHQINKRTDKFVRILKKITAIGL